MNDELKRLSSKDHSSHYEVLLKESIQNDLDDPNLSDKERIYLRRLRNKLRLREVCS